MVLDFADDLQVFLIRLAGGIFQSPVVIKCSPDIRTANFAPHGNSDVRLGDILDRLGILTSHVDAIFVLHDADGILIDLFLWNRSCGKKLISVKPCMLCQCFRNLTSAGIMRAYERHFLSCHTQTIPSSYSLSLPVSA